MELADDVECHADKLLRRPDSLLRDCLAPVCQDPQSFARRSAPCHRLRAPCGVEIALHRRGHRGTVVEHDELAAELLGIVRADIARELDEQAAQPRARVEADLRDLRFLVAPAFGARVDERAAAILRIGGALAEIGRRSRGCARADPRIARFASTTGVAGPRRAAADTRARALPCCRTCCTATPSPRRRARSPDRCPRCERLLHRRARSRRPGAVRGPSLPVSWSTCA